MWPLYSGLHMCYNDRLQKVTKKIYIFIKLVFKNFQSSDYKLQFAYIKMESQVIVNQNVTVNKYLSLVHTARHMQEVFFF